MERYNWEHSLCAHSHGCRGTNAGRGWLDWQSPQAITFVFKVCTNVWPPNFFPNSLSLQCLGGSHGVLGYQGLGLRGVWGSGRWLSITLVFIKVVSSDVLVWVVSAQGKGPLLDLWWNCCWIPYLTHSRDDSMTGGQNRHTGRCEMFLYGKYNYQCLLLKLRIVLSSWG